MFQTARGDSNNLAAGPRPTARSAPVERRRVPGVPSDLIVRLSPEGQGLSLPWEHGRTPTDLDGRREAGLLLCAGRGAGGGTDVPVGGRHRLDVQSGIRGGGDRLPGGPR